MYTPLHRRLMGVALHNNYTIGEADELAQFAIERLSYIYFDTIGLSTKDILYFANQLPRCFDYEERTLVALDVITDKYLRENTLAP